MRYITQSIQLKLTLALLFISLSGVIIVSMLVQQFMVSEFDNFIVQQEQADLAASLTNYYTLYRSWADLKRQLSPLSPHAPTVPPSKNIRIPYPSPPKFIIANQDGKVIMPDEQIRPNRHLSESELEQAAWVVVDGETVGYVLPIEGRPPRDALAEAFLDKINQTLLIATVGVIMLTLVLSILLGRSLSNPLREIAAAIQSISSDNLEQKVPVRSHDEVGKVAAAFNQMSVNLAHANQLRRQMTADIAHELGTPLAIIVGYLESLSEGLLKPTAERFHTMHQEAVHLQHLVEDLRMLSLVDAGELPLNLQWVSPNDLVSMAVSAFTHQAKQQQLALSAQPEPDAPPLHVDPERMMQVFSNLISNAMRYTPENGSITLSVQTKDNHVMLCVQDTGQGIAPEHLPFVFERFYRGDPSRHQEQSESGLGLAIVKSIVEAQGGTIAVNSTLGEGTAFTLSFPAHR